MPRTTIDIDPYVLRELKRRQAKEGGTLGALVSELLRDGLVRAKTPAQSPLRWTTRDLRPRVDLDDPHAVAELLDREQFSDLLE